MTTNPTIRDYIEAMRKNGYPQTRFQLYTLDRNSDVITSACSLGQALINLGILTTSGVDYSREISNEFWTVRTRTIHLNDNAGMSINKVADTLEQEFKHWLDLSIYLELKGSNN